MLYNSLNCRICEQGKSLWVYITDQQFIRASFVITLVFHHFLIAWEWPCLTQVITNAVPLFLVWSLIYRIPAQNWHVFVPSVLLQCLMTVLKGNSEITNAMWSTYSWRQILKAQKQKANFSCVASAFRQFAVGLYLSFVT